MRAVSFVHKPVDEGLLNDHRYRKLLIHRIEAQAELRPLEASSELNIGWTLLKHLHDIGWQAASNWLDNNLGDLNEKSIVNIRAEFL